MVKFTWARASALTVATLVLVLSGALADISAHADSAGQVITVPAGSVSSIACASSHACYAVVSEDSVTRTWGILPIIDGVPGAITPMGGTHDGLAQLTCPTSSECVAVGIHGIAGGYVQPFTVSGDSIVAGPETGVPGSRDMDAVGCADATDCIAMGYPTPSEPPSDASLVVALTLSGNAVTVGQIELLPHYDLGSQESNDAIGCPGHGYCYFEATTQIPRYQTGLVEAVAVSGGTLTFGAPLFDSIGGVFTCASTTLCFEVGQSLEYFNYGGCLPQHPGAWIERFAVNGLSISETAFECLDFTGDFRDLRCGSGVCFAVGRHNGNAVENNAVVLRLVNGLAGTPIPVPGASLLYGVACPTSTMCIAGGVVLPDGEGGGMIVPITVDSAVPTVTPDPLGTEHNGWWSSLSLSWTVTTDGFPILHHGGCVTQTVKTDTSAGSANCSVTTAGGTAGQTFDYKYDATAPSIGITGTSTGPPRSATLTIQDRTSGLASITVPQSSNCTITGTTGFTPGTTAPVQVTAARQNNATSCHITIRATDEAGNVSTLDPAILLTGVGPASPASDRLTDVAGTDSQVTVVNGQPGLQTVMVVVNGHLFPFLRLQGGERRVVDVSAAMHSGDANSVLVLGVGAPGAGAAILLGPPSGSGSGE